MSSGRGTPEYRGPLSARSELSILINRVECLVLPGKISEIDHDAAYARVTMKDKKGKGITTDWLRWLEDTAGDDREWSPPSVGETVLVISPTGNLNAGIIDRSVNTTTYRPISNSATMRRKTYGKKAEDSFFDFPFWELEKAKGKTHVWNYLPSKGEFRHEIGDKVLVHWTEEFLMWRIGNTQYLLKDGSATITISDDLTKSEDQTELRITKAKIELHTNHEAAVTIHRKGTGTDAARVEMQVGGKATIIVKEDAITASVANDSCLSLTAGNATIESKTAKAKLALKAGVTSMSLDGVSCYLTPLKAGLGMMGSELAVTIASVAAASPLFLYNSEQQGAGPGIGQIYVTGPAAATPVPTTPVTPEQAKPRWTMEESKGPHYPRTGKPKK